MAEPCEKGAGSRGIVQTCKYNVVVGCTISQKIAILMNQEHTADRLGGSGQTGKRGVVEMPPNGKLWLSMGRKTNHDASSSGKGHDLLELYIIVRLQST